MSRLAGVALLSALLTLTGGCGGHARPVDQNWQTVALTTDAGFNDVCFADSSHGWAVGGAYDIPGGLIGVTRDGGKTWTYSSGFVSRWPGVSGFDFTAVTFFDSLSGCVVGSGGQIFRTDDGGVNWRLTHAGEGAGLSGLSFVDRWHGWAVGAGVLVTEDGGETWRWAIRGNGDNGYINGSAIQFLDTGTGWMTGQRSIRKTTDGGVTWTSVSLPLADGENPWLRDLDFVDAEHGWAVGDEGTILATADGGVTWTRQTNGVPPPRPRPLQIVHRAHGVDTLDLDGPALGLTLMAVRFVDLDRGWTVGFFPDEGRSVVLRTDDGGATWREEGEAQGQELRGLFVTARGSGWSVGDRVRPGEQVLLRRSPSAL